MMNTLRLSRLRYGIDVSAEEIRSTKAEEIRTTIREKAEVR